MHGFALRCPRSNEPRNEGSSSYSAIRHIITSHNSSYMLLYGDGLCNVSVPFTCNPWLPSYLILSILAHSLLLITDR